MQLVLHEGSAASNLIMDVTASIHWTDLKEMVRNRCAHALATSDFALFWLDDGETVKL